MRSNRLALCLVAIPISQLASRKECHNRAETTSLAKPAAQQSSWVIDVPRRCLVLPRAAGRLRYRPRHLVKLASVRGVAAAASSVSGAQEAL